MSVTRHTLSLFWHHAARYKQYLIPLLILMPMTVVVMEFGLPYITSEVLQKLSDGNYDPNDIWGSFSELILLYAIGTLVSGVIGWRIIIWLLWNLELKAVRDLSQSVFEHLMKLSASFHANHYGGSLVSQTNKLTNAYIRIADTTLFNLYMLVVAILATLIILAPRAPIFAVVLVTLSLIYILGAIRFSKPVRRANRKEAEAQSEQTGSLADSITNVMAVKSFARGGYENKRFWKYASKSRDAGLRSLYITTVRETYASFVTSSISIAALLIAVLGIDLYDGDVSTLFLIVSYTAAIGRRLWDFQNVLRNYNRALGDASGMVKVLQIEPGIKDPEVPEENRISRGEIRINNVVFAHSDSKSPLFENLNLHIKPGEKVGLVGHSGSGKTTLTKILLRFSDIKSGSITIDNQDIRSITQDDLRSRITYVPQEPLLFHRSLAENIAYGRPGATQEEIEAIAKMAHAHDFIIELPDGYETLVGERGVKLSGGQRQRIAIARAMIKNAPILILDEATSALDSESEVYIQDALWKLMEGRTAIVVAHRLSTIQRMDRIVVMDYGKIIEQGSHKELLSKKGMYAKLWHHQTGGFLEDVDD